MKDRHIKIILKCVNQLVPNQRKPKYSSSPSAIARSARNII